MPEHVWLAHNTEQGKYPKTLSLVVKMIAAVKVFSVALLVVVAALAS